LLSRNSPPSALSAASPVTYRRPDAVFDDPCFARKSRANRIPSLYDDMLASVIVNAVLSRSFSLLSARCLDVLAFGDFHTWLVDERQRLASGNFGTPPPRLVFAYFLRGISTGRHPAALRNLATLT